MQTQIKIKSPKQKAYIDKMKVNQSAQLDIQHYNVIKAAINGRFMGYVTAQKNPAA